jgi:hypothetical protein
MTTIDIDTALGWRGRTVEDPDGRKIGELGDVFLDRRTNLPAWATVRTGLFGRRESLVPLAAAEEAGDRLRLPFGEEVVKGAPHVEPDVAPTAAEEARLFEHYRSAGAPPPGDPEGEGMLRSEEEVEVQPGELEPVERVRLRKVLVTDHETRTVPVRREVVQLETERPPDGEIEAVEDAGEAPPEGVPPPER